MKAEAACEGMGEPITLPMLFRSFWSLTKPTISLLVVVTALPSLLLALPEGERLDISVIVAALFGTFLTSASAASFNQIIESSVDASMSRTKSRAIACGQVSRGVGSAFGTFIGLAGLAVLYLFTTPLACIIALVGHLFYVAFYTAYLKPRTPQNIVIGGAAGAVGPLIGWAAATGTLSITAWLLFAIITLWTPPHFWALALKYKDDYAKAGIPMYPVVYGDARTKEMIVRYTWLLLPTVILVFWFSSAGWFYLLTSCGLTVKFILDAKGIARSNCDKRVMPFFYFSCLYTLGIFSSLVADWAIRAL